MVVWVPHQGGSQASSMVGDEEHGQATLQHCGNSIVAGKVKVTVI